LIAIIAVLSEVFVFNFSSWYCKGVKPILLASSVTTDEEGSYISETIVVDADVRNINVKATVDYHELAYVSAILTDEGDKYEYATPEYTMCKGVDRSGFSNIYPFGKVHTIQVKVRVDEGCKATIESITANAQIPVDIKLLRLLIVFVILELAYLIFTQSRIHEIYFDVNKPWQWCLTGVVMLGMMMLMLSLAKSDKLLMDSPWPHHKQYQELAHSLANGSVELTEQYVDPAILEVDNPYDTITLWAENIQYSMDYAFYNGKYYSYFGIVPELLFYYPYLMLKGTDMSNYQVMMILSILLVFAVFWLITGLVRKYTRSLPYVFYMLLCITVAGSANFIYLVSRPDIYNVPILSAVVFTLMGMACLLQADLAKKKWLKRLCLCAGAFSLAMVAGCRPQLLIFSGVAVIWLLFENGWKDRKIFSKKCLVESLLFCLPYLLLAIVVCKYNYDRFGSIFDFGATYTLTTNDMNHRGFNMNRLIRSIYCYLFQPATINTDFPYLNSSTVTGDYMGRFLSEYTYGGIFAANALLLSVWIAVVSGFKKVDKKAKILVVYLLTAGIIIAAFDANCAGVLYRYSCDFAPALIIAAAVMWMIFLDKSQNVIRYGLVVRLAYIAMLLSMAYALLTFVAAGGSINLAADNKELYYVIADYFKF